MITGYLESGASQNRTGDTRIFSPFSMIFVNHEKTTLYIVFKKLRLKKNIY